MCGGGTFTGSERLIKRGIAGYEELFAAQGIAVQKEEHAFHITGSLPAGNYVLRADESSQYATGMLFALSLLEKDSTLTLLPPVESRGYVELTMDVMRQYGVIVTEKEPNVFFIAGGQHYQAATYAIEGDWSNAAVLFAYNAFGSTLQIQGLSRASKQADRNCEELIHQVVHKTAQTKPLDLSQNPDLAPLLFAAAAAAKGGHFVGIQRLRNKESNRVAAMCEELAKFGIACKEGENEIIIEQAALQRPQEVLNGHNDHRIVMALTFLASLVGGSIEGAQAVNKSWREFFPTLQTLGLRVQWEEITNKK